MSQKNELGWVYILQNDAFKTGMIKIGFTNKSSPYERAQELSKHTGVPTEFDVVYAVKVANAHDLETRVHHALQHKRASQNREFFECSVNEAVQTIVSQAGKHILAKIDNRHSNGKNHALPEKSSPRKKNAPNKLQNRGLIFTMLILLVLFFAAMMFIGWNVEQKENAQSPQNPTEKTEKTIQKQENHTQDNAADDVQAAWLKIPPEIRETLNEEQQEWLKQRKSRCAKSPNPSECEQKANAQRVKYLRGFSI